MTKPRKLEQTDDIGRDLEMEPINPERVLERLADYVEGQAQWPNGGYPLTEVGRRQHNAFVERQGQLFADLIRLNPATLRQQAALIRQQQAALERVRLERDRLQSGLLAARDRFKRESVTPGRAAWQDAFDAAARSLDLILATAPAGGES